MEENLYSIDLILALPITSQSKGELIDLINKYKTKYEEYKTKYEKCKKELDMYKRTIESSIEINKKDRERRERMEKMNKKPFLH